MAVTNYDIRKQVGADYDLTSRALVAVERDLGKPDIK